MYSIHICIHHLSMNSAVMYSLCLHLFNITTVHGDATDRHFVQRQMVSTKEEKTLPNRFATQKL